MAHTPSERPLAAVRGALDREYHALESVLRSHSAEIEARIKEAEERSWRRERELRELEGYLSRAAAIVGVELGERPDWSKVVAGVNSAVERAAAATADASRLRQAVDRAGAVTGKSSTHAVALARIAARLGLSTTSAPDLLRAIDRLMEHAR